LRVFCAISHSDEKKKKAAEKLVEKTDQAKVKAKQAEDAYKQAIEKANEARKKYISEQMPGNFGSVSKTASRTVRCRSLLSSSSSSSFGVRDQQHLHIAGNKRFLF
jgi:type IV secretory pathway TrbF-like protein